MTTPQTARQVMDRWYLEVRARLIALAATLDRIDRADADGTLQSDPRLDLVRQSLDVLQSDGDDRAERIQMIFSDPYDPDWDQ